MVHFVPTHGEVLAITSSTSQAVSGHESSHQPRQNHLLAIAGCWLVYVAFDYNSHEYL